MKDFNQDVDVNLGICPHCNYPVHFRKTKKDNVYICPLCFEKAEQHINGKVLFTKVSFNLKDEGIL
mgnify:CR=1 FL=1